MPDETEAGAAADSGPSPTFDALGRDARGMIGKVLHSSSFARSRRAADVVSGDPRAEAALVAQVRDVIDDPALAEGRDLIEKALALVVRPLPDAGSPIESAHRHLAVAALHYLVSVDDVIPDDRPLGSIDDLVVLRAVLGPVVGDQAGDGA